MQEPYEAAQCPICRQWVRVVIGTALNFVEHGLEVQNVPCPYSGREIPDSATIEKMTHFALPTQEG